jgi:hypothetical protein
MSEPSRARPNYLNNPITVFCDFAGREAPFAVHTGDPVDDAHPVEQQAAWLERERGGTIPAQVMESFRTLHQIAMDNSVNFHELCVYAFDEAQKEQNPESP